MAADSKRVAASDQRVQQRLVKCGRLEKGLYIFGREVSPCPEALALFASWPWRLATWLKNRRRGVPRGAWHCAFSASRIVCRAGDYQSGKVNVGAEIADEAPPPPPPVLECDEGCMTAIFDCLEEGCSVDALLGLQGHKTIGATRC